jgi:protein SCO1
MTLQRRSTTAGKGWRSWLCGALVLGALGGVAGVVEAGEGQAVIPTAGAEAGPLGGKLAVELPPSRMEPLPAEKQGVGVDQHVGASLPLDAMFTDEKGNQRPLKDFFDGKRPVLLQLGYFGCPMLCGEVSRGAVGALKDLKLRAGEDYRVVFASIDPTEGSSLAAEKKKTYILATGAGAGAETGWHFLTGQKSAIDELTRAVGFNYKWVDALGQYSHPAVLMVITPEGKVSRYLFGVRYDASTVRLSLVEASAGKIGSVVDEILMVCLHFDAAAGKYSPRAMGIMRVAGVTTVFGLASAVGLMVWREQRLARRVAAAGGVIGKVS